MTIHVRRQLREAASTLVAGLSTTGANVFQSRMRPPLEGQLPCLLVSTNDEVVDSATIDGKQMRELSLVVMGMAKATVDVDDTLDAIALEVETAIATDADLGGLAASVDLRAIKVDFDHSTEKPVGLIQIDYRITYFTLAGSPGVTV